MRSAASQSDCLAERGEDLPHFEPGFVVKFLGPLDATAAASSPSPQPAFASDFVTVVPHVSEIGSMLGSWDKASPGPSSEAVRDSFCRWREVLEAGTGVAFEPDPTLGREQLDRSSVWGFLDWLCSQRAARPELGAIVVVSHGDFMRNLFRELDSFHDHIRNGQVFVLAASWPGDAAEDASRRLLVYVVRHCVSCSNVLAMRRGAPRRRPTLCADLEHVYAAARAILRAEARRTGRGLVKLCSSSLPRAMLTAAALFAGLRGERLDPKRLLGLVRDANADPELGPTCCTVGAEGDGLQLDGSPRDLDAYVAEKGLAPLTSRTFAHRERGAAAASQSRRGRSRSRSPRR